MTNPNLESYSSSNQKRKQTQKLQNPDLVGGSVDPDLVGDNVDPDLVSGRTNVVAGAQWSTDCWSGFPPYWFVGRTPFSRSRSQFSLPPSPLPGRQDPCDSSLSRGCKASLVATNLLEGDHLGLRSECVWVRVVCVCSDQSPQPIFFTSKSVMLFLTCAFFNFYFWYFSLELSGVMCLHMFGWSFDLSFSDDWIEARLNGLSKIGNDFLVLLAVINRLTLQICW